MAGVGRSSCSCSSGRWSGALKLGDEGDEIGVQGLQHLSQLDQIQATLALLELADHRLLNVEASSEVSLPESQEDSTRLQHPTETVVVGRVNGLFHSLILWGRVLHPKKTCYTLFRVMLGAAMEGFMTEQDVGVPRPQRRWKWAAATTVLILMVGGFFAWKTSGPSEREREQQHTDDIADYQSSMPQGEDAWDKVSEVCNLGSGAGLVDYEADGGDDGGFGYDAYYDYEDDASNEHMATVSLSDYGTITWVDSCDHIDGIDDGYADRVDVHWGGP